MSTYECTYKEGKHCCLYIIILPECTYVLVCAEGYQEVAANSCDLLIAFGTYKDVHTGNAFAVRYPALFLLGLF